MAEENHVAEEKRAADEKRMAQVKPVADDNRVSKRVADRCSELPKSRYAKLPLHEASYHRDRTDVLGPFDCAVPLQRER